MIAIAWSGEPLREYLQCGWLENGGFPACRNYCFQTEPTLTSVVDRFSVHKLLHEYEESMGIILALKLTVNQLFLPGCVPHLGPSNCP